MIPIDDAREQLEFEDYYIIQPDFSFWERRSSRRMAGNLFLTILNTIQATNPWILTALRNEGDHQKVYDSLWKTNH